VVQLNAFVDVNIDFGPTLFGGSFTSPNMVSATTIQSFVLTPPGPSLPALQAGNAASEQQAAIFNALPVAFTETDLGRTTSYRLTIPQGQALGFELPAGYTHSLGINSNNNFDFDPRDGVDVDKVDFEASVVRELGHILGFISSTGAQELTPTEPTRPTVWICFASALVQALTPSQRECVYKAQEVTRYFTQARHRCHCPLAGRTGRVAMAVRRRIGKTMH